MAIVSTVGEMVNASAERFKAHATVSRMMPYQKLDSASEPEGQFKFAWEADWTHLGSREELEPKDIEGFSVEAVRITPPCSTSVI